MSALRSGSARIGVVGGALFFLNGLIDGSRSYPFIWPALAGAVAFWVATRATHEHRLRRGLLAALIAGLVAGLIGFVGASATILVAGRADFSAVQANAGMRAELLMALAAELGIGAACLVAVAAAVAGGVLMTPVRWLRPPGAGAPAA